MDNQRTIAGDWYAGPIPATVDLGADVYIESAYSFKSTAPGARGTIDR